MNTEAETGCIIVLHVKHYLALKVCSCFKLHVFQHSLFLFINCCVQLYDYTTIQTVLIYQVLGNENVSMFVAGTQ